MDTLEYVYQSPHTAQWALCTTPSALASFHVERFRRMRTETHGWKGYKITATIIGESHVIEVERSGRPVLAELLACVDPRVEPYLVEPDHCVPMRGIRKFQREYSAWKTCVRIVPSASPRIAARNKRLVWEIPGWELIVPGIVETFPGTHAPRTVVYVEGQGEHIIRIRTLHEYVTRNGRCILPLMSETTVDLDQLRP